MAWTSPYQSATFTEPLIRQLIAIVNRDMPAALAWATTEMLPEEGGALPTFTTYLLGAQPEFQPPLLLLTDAPHFDLDVQPDVQAQVIEVQADIVIAHQSPSKLASRGRAYVAALKAVLDAAWKNTQGEAVSPFLNTTLPLPSPPFSPGLTAPGLATNYVNQMLVSQFGLAALRQKGQGFERLLTVMIQVEMNEV